MTVVIVATGRQGECASSLLAAPPQSVSPQPANSRAPVLHLPPHDSLAGMTDMPLLHFTSVPMLRRRASGWSPAAQRAFIDMLARCGVVAQAARSVGCSPRSAYQLRQKQGAESFAAAWDWALEMGLDAARAQAIALARCAQVRPIVRRGVVVGHRRAPDNRVMLAAMRTICAERSGARAAMPHRQRIALRDLVAELSTSAPEIDLGCIARLL